MALTRRRFLMGAVAATSLGGGAWLDSARAEPASEDRAALPGADQPKVVIVRYGGCVRPRETIASASDPSTSLSRHLFDDLLPQGTVYSRVLNTEETGHSAGTLYLFTGRYGNYPDGLTKPKYPFDPTLGEYARKHLSLTEEQVLVVQNYELDYEFTWASTAEGYGPGYRWGVVSPYRLRKHLLERELARARDPGTVGSSGGAEVARLSKLLHHHLEECYWPRDTGFVEDSPAIREWWDRYLAGYEPPGARQRFGRAPAGYWSGAYDFYERLLPKGDPGWTATALSVLAELRPRVLAVLYNDVDYAHWGIPYLYQRGIERMDEGLAAIATYLDRDPYYRGTTTLIVSPEAGRGTSPYDRLPYQHHNKADRGSHELFVYARGPGIARGRRVDTEAHIVDVVPTAGHVLGIPTSGAEGRILSDLFA